MPSYPDQYTGIFSVRGGMTVRGTVVAVLVGALLGGGGLVSGLHGIALAAQAPPQTVTYVPRVTTVFPGATVNSGLLINGASVKVALGLVAAEDRLFLEYYGGASIAPSYDATTGTLTISGAAYGHEWGNILRSVRYTNAADRPKKGDRLVVAQLNSGAAPTSFFDRFKTTIRVLDKK